MHAVAGGDELRNRVTNGQKKAVQAAGLSCRVRGKRSGGLAAPRAPGAASTSVAPGALRYPGPDPVPAAVAAGTCLGP